MKFFKIEFKETYMPNSVIRECEVYDLNKAIEIYGLNNSDIEHWKVLEEREVDG